MNLFFKRKIYQVIFINILFLLTSWISVNAVVHNQSILTIHPDDYAYHAQQMHQMIIDFFHHNDWFNTYAFNSFGNVGAGVNNFYSTLVLIPYVCIYLLIHNWYLSFKIGTILYLYLSLCLNFKVWSNFSRNYYSSVKIQYLSGLIFTFIYNIGADGLYHLIPRADFGTFIAFILFPTLFLSWWELLINKVSKRNKFILPITLALITYSHVLSTYLIFILIGIMTIIYLVIDKTNFKTNLHNLASSFIIYIFLVAYYIRYLLKYLPAVHPTKNFQLNTRTLSVLHQLQLTFSGRVLNDTYYVLLGCLIIFPFIYKKAPKFYQISFWISILLSFLMHPSFLWTDLQNFSFIQIIQFPYRIFFFVSFFISVVATFILVNLINKRRHIATLTAVITCSACLVLFLQSSKMVNNLLNNMSKEYNGSLLVHTMSEFPTIKLPFSMNNKSISSIVKDGSNQSVFYDYWPKKAVLYHENKKFNKHGDTDYDYHKIATINYHKIFTNKRPKGYLTIPWNWQPPASEKVKMSKPTQYHNKIKFNLDNPKKQVLDLPILNYKNQYKMLVNNKNTKYHSSDRGTIKAKFPNGKSKITLITKPILGQRFLVVVSMLTWVVVLYQLVKFSYYNRKLER